MKKYLIALATVGLLSTSCYEKLNITPPNKITEEQVKELLATADDATIENIMGGIAGALPSLIMTQDVGTGTLEIRSNRHSGQDVMRCYEGNDIVFGQRADAGGFGMDEYQMNDFTSQNTDKNYPYWKLGWQWITAANKVLNILDAKTVGDKVKLKQYEAWALVIRAYAYNYLLENYQIAYMQGGKDKLGVPYYNKYDVGQAYQPRAAIQACYDSINKDLDKAIGNLTMNGGTGFTKEAGDIDANVAYFIKARVALCTGQWSEAINACDQIITNSQASLMTEDQYVAQLQMVDGKKHYFGVNSGFLNIAKNPETLWGWTVNEGANTSFTGIQFLNTYGSCQGGSSGNNARIDDRLYDKIADEDYRKDNFMTAEESYIYAGTNVTKRILKYANLKFAATVGVQGDITKPDESAKTTSTANDYTLMRLSEVYLMKAEAQAQSGTGDALATLDPLVGERTNGIYTASSYPYPADVTTPLQKIQLQSRIEMWGENGLEYYNNKRWGLPVNRAGSNVHWQDAQMAPSAMKCMIPYQATNFNGLLVQD